MRSFLRYGDWPESVVWDRLLEKTETTKIGIGLEKYSRVLETIGWIKIMLEGNFECPKSLWARILGISQILSQTKKMQGPVGRGRRPHLA